MADASENTFKVPSKQWRKWTPAARKVFNRTYDDMLNNQHVFLHPKTAAVPQEQWKTTAWNAAWTAADAVDDVLTSIVVDYKGSKEVARRAVKRLLQETTFVRSPS